MTAAGATVTLPALEEVLDAVHVPDGTRCVFLSGSVVAGWGHAHSDIDVYVVTPERFVPPGAQQLAGLFGGTVDVVATHSATRRFDVEYWPAARIDEALRAVKSTAERAGRILADEEIDFLYRLRIAVPLDGHDWLRRCQQGLEEAGLRQAVTWRSVDQAEAFCEDAGGLLTSGDVPSAVLAARHAFMHSVDAVTASCGELAPGPKWRARKVLAAAHPSLPWDDYWRVETMRDLDPEHEEAWVEDVVLRCQDLIADIDLR